MRPALPCLAVGLLLRGVAVWASCGWFAPDDLGLGIEQPATWLRDPAAPMADGIRSPLLSWTMWACLSAAARLGIDDPGHQLRLAYAFLGIYSLGSVVGTYLLAAPLGRAAQRAAAWLVAGYAIMPLVSVRALVEVLASVPLVFALVCLERARAPVAGRAAWRWALAAGLLLAAATLLRFQLGGLWPLLVARVAWPLGLTRGAGAVPAVAVPAVAEAAVAEAAVAEAAGRGPVGGRRGRGFGAPGALAAWCARVRWRLAAAMGAGLAMAGVAQAALDLALGRAPGATVRGYIDFNLHHGAGLGTSPWYTYLGHLLVFTVPPATLWLARPMWHALRRTPTVALALGGFVALHSLVPHKEDRFLFTILPLCFVPLGAALVALRRGTAWQRGARWLFLSANAVALAAATTSDAHRNLTVPLRAVGREVAAPSVAAVGFRPFAVPRFYLGPRGRLALFADRQALVAAVAAGEMRPDAVLLRQVPSAGEQAAWARGLPGLACSAPAPCPGDWVDRLLVAANRHNWARAPTAVLRCYPAAGGAAGF